MFPSKTYDTVSLPLKGSVAAACGLCAQRLLEHVRALHGVEHARMDSATTTLTIAFDPARVSSALVSEQTEQSGARLAQQFGHRRYQIGGLDCAHCASVIEKMARRQPGVVAATVNFAAATLHVEHTAGTTGIDQIVPRAQVLGFTLQDAAAGETGQRPEQSETPAGLHRFRHYPVGAIASGLLLVLGLALEHALNAPAPWSQAVLLASVFGGGHRFALAGLHALRARSVGTNLLMALAAAGALALGHIDEAAAVVFLYALGEALEQAALARTRRSLRALVDAAPLQALVERPDGRHETIDAVALAVGDVMVVKPGAKVAADGVILSGVSSLSEAAVTGESLPRDKNQGDSVFAGSLNGNGALRVRVAVPASDSTLARILHLVETAQAQKAPLQAQVERFGRVYTPLVLASALGLVVLGPLVAPGSNWLYRALTLLVVSCPCALVIATPVTYVSAIARAARGGVLVKGGACLEALAQAQHLFLDKTGTLTTGQPQVSDVYAVGCDEETLLALAAAAERHSEHPLAHAVVAEAERRGIVIMDTQEVAALPGRGVTAQVDNREVLVGNALLLAERGVVVGNGLRAEAERLQAAGRTTLLVACDGAARGVLAVTDTLRDEAGAAVAALHKLGLRTTLLTGDNAAVAGAVGTALGIADVRAGLLPQDKLVLVQTRSGSGQNVVFVGDGINDAPALAAANVGVAMGACGSATALEAADLALTGDDLSRLPWAIRLARVTRAAVRWNMAIAIGAVVLLLASTFSGLLPLPLGVLGHEGSALLVILNGLRLSSPRWTRL